MGRMNIIIIYRNHILTPIPNVCKEVAFKKTLYSLPLMKNCLS